MNLLRHMWLSTMSTTLTELIWRQISSASFQLGMVIVNDHAVGNVDSKAEAI